MQFKATREAHAGTVDALVSFMNDCRFDASDLTAATLSLALEYVCQPHPRFWRDFNMAFLIRALTLCVFPTGAPPSIAPAMPREVRKGCSRTSGITCAPTRATKRMPKCCAHCPATYDQQTEPPLSIGFPLNWSGKE